MEDESTQRARQELRKGLAAQQRGDLESAIEAYSESIRLHPTADAYTYRAWAKSFQGMLEEAIEECRVAIRLDPEYGNPYNDIGVYLMQMGRHEEAIRWLQRATRAQRYESPHFPHVNLACINEQAGRLVQAVTELDKALDYVPGDREILTQRHRLLAQLN